MLQTKGGRGKGAPGHALGGTQRGGGFRRDSVPGATSRQQASFGATREDPLLEEEEGRAEALRRQLREQNELFWETAQKKDESIVLLRAECESLAEELCQASSQAALGGTPLEKQEARTQEAEEACAKLREELRGKSRDALERVRRHSENLEALSNTLCTSQSQFQEAELALEAERAEADALRRELAEFSLDPHEDLARCREEEQRLMEDGVRREAATEARLAAMASAEQAAWASAQAAETLAEQGKEMLALEESARQAVAEEASRAFAEERVAQLEAAIEASLASDLAEQVQVADKKEMTMEEAVARSAEKARDAQQETSLEEAAVRAARADTEGAVQEAQASKARADRLMARLHEEQEELRRERSMRESSERIAAGAAQMLEDAQKRATDAEERRVKAERLFFAEQLSAKRDEVAAVEAEASIARKAMGLEVISEATFRRTAAEAEKKETELRAEKTNLEEGVARLSSELQAAQGNAEASLLKAAWSEETLAEEELEASAQRQALLASEAEAKTRASAALDEALGAAEAATSREERYVAELQEELEAQEALRKQVKAAQAQVTKLQEAAQLKLEIEEERAAELASVKADATRHARFNTELRAELADTKRELSKCRHAARSLSQVSDELEATLLKLNKAQRGRESFEGELEAARQKQASLERQLSTLRSQVAQPPVGFTGNSSYHPHHAPAAAYLAAPGCEASPTSMAAGAAGSPTGGLGRSQSLGLGRSQPVSVLASQPDAGGGAMAMPAQFPANPADSDGGGCTPGRPPLGPVSLPGGFSTMPRPPASSGARHPAPASGSVPPPRRGGNGGGGCSEAPSPNSTRRGSRSPLNRSASEAFHMCSDGVNAIDKVVR